MDAETCLSREFPAKSMACESGNSAACIVPDMVDNIATAALGTCATVRVRQIWRQNGRSEGRDKQFSGQQWQSLFAGFHLMHAARQASPVEPPTA